MNGLVGNEWVDLRLSSPDILAANVLSQLAENPRIVALRNFIMGWHVSHLSAEDARGQPEAGPQEQLSKTGDNLANVIQYLSEEHPERLASIFQRLRERVPNIEKVTADLMLDGGDRQALEVAVAYGFPVHRDALVLTPEVGWTLSPQRRDYRLTWSLQTLPEDRRGNWNVSLEAWHGTPVRNTSAADPEHSLTLRFATLLGQ